MMIKQQSCFYCNILLYQPLYSTSLTETNDLRVMRMYSDLFQLVTNTHKCLYFCIFCSRAYFDLS